MILAQYFPAVLLQAKIPDGFFRRELVAPNTIENWSWFLGILLAGLLLRTVVSRLISKGIFRFFGKRDSTRIGFSAMYGLVRRPFNFFLLLITVFIACQQLTWPKTWHMAPPDQVGIRMVLERTFYILLEFSFLWILLRLTDFFGLILKMRAERTPGKEDDQLVPFLRESIKVVLVIIGIFFILGSVFHLNIASLIAGLGIGGIAVALAAKESLENLIASFAIFLDKPFAVGDVIQMGTQTGTIETIGFRSTRIRAEDRSFITVPNRKMVENEIVNISRRTARRVRMIVSFNYSSSPEKLRSFIIEATAMLNNHPALEKDQSRVSLFELSPSAFDVQVLYYIPDLDFDLFLRTKEEVNFSVAQVAQNLGLAFAYPSTSVYIERGPESKNA
jgi:MscS family membrane protein